MRELIEVEPSVDDFEWQKQLRTYLPAGTDERNDRERHRRRMRDYQYL